jgi:hypothetical protein
MLHHPASNQFLHRDSFLVAIEFCTAIAPSRTNLYLDGKNARRCSLPTAL